MLINTLIAKKYMLHEGIQIIPISTFHKNFLRRLGGDRDDLVVSIRHSRIPSKRINKEAAEFLEHFRTPCSIVNAIIAHAAATNIEPQSLLNDVYEFVVSCIQSKILINPESIRVENGTPRLKDGSYFKGLKISYCVQYLTDTQLYQVETTTGAKAALKYVEKEGSPQIIAALQREVIALRHLKSQACLYVPQIIESSIENDDRYIISTWCEGKTLFKFLQQTVLRGKEKFKLIHSILNAYRSLDAAGVLHGDVHPNNVIVDDSFQVWLIDFGLSAIDAGKEKLVRLGRVGSISYYSPELALAELNKKEFRLDAFSEQYNIAVLIYLVVTGNMYLPLSLEKEKALHQIISEQPRPFNEFFIAWPEMEKVLFRALAKTPNLRFESLSDFFYAIEIVIEKANNESLKIEISQYSTFSTPNNKEPFKIEINRFTTLYGFYSSRITKGLDIGPTASLFHGAAGIAYLFLRMSILFQNPVLLATSEIWIQNAKRELSKKRAFVNKEIGLVIDQIRPCSLFHHRLGIYLVEALVQYARSDSGSCETAVQNFIRHIEPCYINGRKYANPLDLSQGPGGILIGISHLLRLDYINDNVRHKLTTIVQVCFEQLLAQLKSDLLSEEIPEKSYLGFAHGYAGILYAILVASEAAKIETPIILESFFRRLESFCIKEKNMMSWPIYSNLPSPVWSGWCHGSSGYVLLWLRAYKTYKSDVYLRYALGAGEHILNHCGTSGPSLCCGIVGESLSLLSLARATASKRWYNRSMRLARFAMRGENPFKQPNSLFKGTVGQCSLAAEALFPSSIAWPIIEFPL